MGSHQRDRPLDADVLTWAATGEVMLGGAVECCGSSTLVVVVVVSTVLFCFFLIH